MVPGDRDALRSLRRAVTRAVIPEGPPSTLLQRSCEALVDSELYAVAWIGLADADCASVVPAAAAGAELEELADVPLNASPDRWRTTVEAVESREIRVETGLSDDAATAFPSGTDDGDRTIAAVPLCSDGTLHGVLTLLTSRQDAFADDERERLAEVAEMVAYALEERETTSSETLVPRDVAAAAVERKERERELEQYRTITQTASDAIVVIDESSVVRSANQAVEDVFGYEPEELRGKPLVKLMSDQLWQEHRKGFQHYLETGEHSLDWNRVELPGRHRDGHDVPLAISYSEYEYDGERYFVGIIRDVTERTQYERALDELHAATRDLITAETAADVAERTLDTATRVLDLDGVGVYLFDEADNELQPAAVTEYVEELFGEVPTFSPGDTSITWEAFLAGETVTYDDVSESADVHTTKTPLRSGIWIPLGEHGVVAIVSEAVDGIDRQAEELADHLAATAEAALDRVAREERLRDHERELAEQNRRLRTLDRMNSVIREIDQRLVAATTKADVERSVCELLTRNERFAFAWIGGVEGGSVVPRTAAGDGRGYLDETSLTIGSSEAGTARRGDGGDGATVEGSDTTADGSDTTADGSDATADGDDGTTAITGPSNAGEGGSAGNDESAASLADPAVATAASGEVTVVTNTASELGSAPWRRAALSRGLQSAIAVPIRYGETRYGVLAVYAAETDAFDDLTRSVFAELGETIGNAMHAVETERALLTDSVVELDLAIQDTDDPLVGIVEDTGCTLTFEGIVPQGTGAVRVFFTTTGVDADDVLAAAERSSRFDRVTRLDSQGDEHRFEAAVAGRTVPSTLVECGAAVESVRITSEETRTVVELPHSIDVRTFADRLEATYPGAELVARRDKERSDPSSRGIESELESELTERQLEVLQTAYLSGYFEWPRDRTGEEVAATLDITQSTFNGHLRAAERKLCALLFEHVQDSD